MACPTWPETLVSLDTLWHEPPSLVPPPRVSSAHCRLGGNSWRCLGVYLKPHSFLCTFGVEGHAQPGPLGKALVCLEMLPHKDVLHFILDGQHCAANCRGKTVMEEPRTERTELGSSSAQEDKVEDLSVNHMMIGQP